MSKKTKYNLTIWQKLELPLLWLWWSAAPEGTKKSWHEVKKGMEKHEHKFTIPIKEYGYNFLRCEHEGCRVCDPID